MEIWILVIAVGIVALVVAAYSHLQDQKRTEQIRDLASMSGMNFTERDDSLLTETFAGIELMRKGSGRKAKNILRTRADGKDVVLFRYEYHVDKSTFKQTAAGVRDPERALPRFQLTPESVFLKIGASFGMQDIDFDSSPTFSESYRLTGDDEAAVRRLFRSDVLSFFATETSWSIEGSGEWVVVYRRRDLVNPDQLAEFAEKAIWISDLFRET